MRLPESPFLHLSDIRPPEIELEKEIEIEKEREGETGHPAPAAYGRYNNVILTDTELSGLKTELPDKWEYYIDRLSCHIASTGKQYHSHAATIYKWAQEDAAKGKAAPKQGIPDYSCKEGESLTSHTERTATQQNDGSRQDEKSNRSVYIVRIKVLK